MTTSLTARPVPARSVPAPNVVAAPPGAACPIELRALRTGARTLADALAGIALDAPCDRARQGAVVDLARLVLGGVRGSAARTADDDVLAAAARVREALPTFAHDVSAGAPALALACAVLADRLDGRAADVPVHDHGRQSSPVPCVRRSLVGTGPARAVVPWFLGAAGTAERMAVVRDAPRRVRWALRLGEARHLRTVQLVRG